MPLKNIMLGKESRSPNHWAAKEVLEILCLDCDGSSMTG